MDEREDKKSLFLQLILDGLTEPEPQCSICGRIILCGVDELCKEDPCGLKGK